jgi:hypothetical protein
VGGGRQVFELLASEDVEGDQVDLGVTVLAGLGGGHLDNLAGTVLDDNVTVLAQSRALHGESGRRASVGGLEGLVLYPYMSVSEIMNHPCSIQISFIPRYQEKAFSLYSCVQPSSKAQKWPSIGGEDDAGLEREHIKSIYQGSQEFRLGTYLVSHCEDWCL